jgi:3-hydroxybutyryl-CoA dehydrogenase
VLFYFYPLRFCKLVVMKVSNIILICSDAQVKAFQTRFTDVNLHAFASFEAVPQDLWIKAQALIDCSLEISDAQLAFYTQEIDGVVLVNGVANNVLSAFNALKDGKAAVATMNLWPTFVELPKAEISVPLEKHQHSIQQFFESFNWPFEKVACRVGLVTPRVIAMIINEACYTVQEGTAVIKDIDLAMKLGTNYPFGPFEWANRIGIENVYGTLAAMYQDTQEERYKICPLLKTYYLRKEAFPI